MLPHSPPCAFTSAPASEKQRGYRLVSSRYSGLQRVAVASPAQRVHIGSRLEKQARLSRSFLRLQRPVARCPTARLARSRQPPPQEAVRLSPGFLLLQRL